MHVYRDPFYHGEAELVFAAGYALGATKVTHKPRRYERPNPSAREIAGLMRDSGVRLKREGRWHGVLTRKVSRVPSDVCYC